MNIPICADGFPAVCANVSKKARNKLVLFHNDVTSAYFPLNCSMDCLYTHGAPAARPAMGSPTYLTRDELNFSPTVNMVMRTPWKPHAITTYPRKKCPDSGRTLRFLPRGVSLFTVF